MNTFTKHILNEVSSYYNGLLNESISNNLLYQFFNQIPSEVGCNGSLSEEDVPILYYVCSGDLYVIDEDEDEDDWVLNPEFSFLDNAFKQYANSMGRRRPESVLPYDNFINYAFYYANCFEYKESYIFGQYKEGYFHPSHFCPKNMMEGYEMLYELTKYDNIIFSVTDDLAPMLLKLGLYGHDMAKIPMVFRDELVMKNILTTDRKLINYFIQKFINEDENLFEFLRKFGNNGYEDDEDDETLYDKVHKDDMQYPSDEEDINSYPKEKIFKRKHTKIG